MRGEAIMTLEDELWEVIDRRARDSIGDNRPTCAEWRAAMKSVCGQLMSHARERVSQRQPSPAVPR